MHEAADDDPGELVALWQRRSGRVAATAWLYHVGLDAFSLIEHTARRKRLAKTFALLLVRDLGASAVIAASQTPATTARRLSYATLLSDVAAAGVARGNIASSDFTVDRSLSQFGLSAAWARQLTRSDGRASTGPYLTPPLVQALLAAMWRLPRRDAVRYVATEGAWSVTALYCINDLLACMQAAVRDGLDAARDMAALAEEEVEAPARETAADDAHDRINRDLTRFRFAAERAERRTRREPILQELARAEDDRLRNLPEPLAVTVNALRWRLLAARHPSPDAPPDVAHELSAEGLALYTKRRDRDVVRALGHAVAAASGDVSIALEVRDSMLSVTIDAKHFGPTKPDQLSYINVRQRERVTVDLALQPGRHQ